ncbi:MAG: MFS transporter [Fusobacteriaceae bacterium]
MGTDNSKNKKLIYLEGMSSNVVTLGVQSFSLVALAIYFECSTFWLSVMSSLPIGAQLLQFFIGRFYKVFKDRKKALFFSVLLGRIPFLMIPLFIAMDLNKSWILITSVLIYSFFNSFALNVWTSAIRDTISRNERGRFFSKRFVLISISSVVFSSIAGNILNIENKKIGLFFLTSILAVSAILTVIFTFFQEVPTLETQMEKIKLSVPLQNKNFKNFLIFIAMWNFSLEFTRPYFSYFSAVKIGVPYGYLGSMASVTAVLSIVIYPIMGKLGDKFGNKKLLSKGIICSTYAILFYCVMGAENFKSLLLFDGIVTAISWSAINLCLFNLLLEVAEDPIDSYVATYYITVGAFGIIGGVTGGIVAEIMKNTTISVIGDKYSGLQAMFLVGILFRIYSILLLTRVESFEKPIYYEGFFPFRINMFGLRK